MLKYIFYALFFCFTSCKNKPDKIVKIEVQKQQQIKPLKYDTAINTAHIFVALCDNQYQGIIPVPAAIGNGDDYENNLYWGCSFGIKSYFKNSNQWKLIRKIKIDSIKLERLVFKNQLSSFYLVCDAYRGKEIKQCTVDFLNSTSGLLKDTIQIDKNVLGINTNAKLLAYIGHDGLMDFKLKESFNNVDSLKRDVVILACKSKKYFSPYIKNAKANPLLWTTDLMCPEAYTIHDLLNIYIKNPNDVNAMNAAAAKAYAKHQKCSVKSASGLLVGGF